jgi:hypothetical protein
MQVKKQQDELTRRLEKRASARSFSTLRWFDHNSYEELAIKRRLPSLEKARKGRNGLSQAKIPNCSRVTPSRSPCDTRTVLTRLSES